LRRLWLIFAQAVTITLAVLMVVQTWRPDLLDAFAGRRAEPPVRLATPSGTGAIVRDHAPRSGSYSEAVEAATPAVVNINIAKAPRGGRHPFMEDPLFRRFFGEMFEGDAQRPASLGSGVIVAAHGYVVTNNHVVEAASGIEVGLADGRRLRAKIVGADPETDLAVLKVEGDGLPAIRFGESDTLRVGDVVLAIGNPFGVGKTVTMGIVSALGRNNLDINTYENFIQTDAAINPGNSGGALIDADGHLVGINSAIYSRSGGSLGIGFAIPVSTARNVIEQLIATGQVTRGWIGVEAQEVTAELAESFRLPAARGALVANVVRGGPAETAGVRAGDVLLDIGGRPIPDRQAMLNVVANLAPAQSVPVRLWRDQKEVAVQVTTGTRPKLPRRR